MDLGTRTILVSGASGWLGTSLVSALAGGLPEIPELAEPAKGARIRCLVLPGERGALAGIADNIDIIEGDVRRPGDCERFCADAKGAVLFHVAGLIHPRRVRDLEAVNVGGTRNVLDAAIAAGVRRAVVVSSNSPFGFNPHPDHLFDEHSECAPYMGYGRSKMRMEEAVRAAVEGGRIETAIVRCPWFYGPRQPARQSLFFRMIRDGKMPIVGRGANLRSMSYVDNLCQGLLLCALRERANGQAYWIADERPYSMNEIVDTVERLLEEEFGEKCAHRRARLPGVASAIAEVADGVIQALGFYSQKIHVLSELGRSIACSVRLAKEELGYRPTVALEEGMRRSIAWMIGHPGPT